MWRGASVVRRGSSLRGAPWRPLSSQPSRGPSGRQSSAVTQSSELTDTREGALGAGKPMDLNPPRGTRDFYPEDLLLRRWLFDHWRASALAHGFEEYDAPVVESEELYLRKGGEEISQQLYSFSDKSDRRLCLRPEMTPSLARMILAKRSQLPLPLKWFSLPQCWRYERMSKGRRREHYQWNMDIWGVQSTEAEGELLATLTFALSSMGLTAEDIVVKINSRKLIISLLSVCGDLLPISCSTLSRSFPVDISAHLHIPACVVIDKLDKLSPEAVTEELIALGVSSDSVQKLLSLLKLSTIEEFSAVLPGCDGLKELSRLFTVLRCYGIDSWMQFDPKIVRGLSYYTGTVFECFDRKGEFRAVCGGGRYDTLLTTYANTSDAVIPAVGFGFGDAVIVELLKAKNLLPDFSAVSLVDVVVAVTDDDPSLYTRAVSVASRLRTQHWRVDLVLQPKRMKSVLQLANRLKAEQLVVFSSHEAKGGLCNAIVKSLGDRTQRIVSDDEILGTLDSMREKK